MNKILFKTFLKTAGVGAKLELTPESNESVDDLSRLITRWPLFLLLVLLHSWTTTLIYYTHVSKIIVSNGPHESRDPWVEKISVHRLVVKQLPVGNSRRRIPCIIKFWISLNTSTIQTEKLSNWEPSAQIHYRTYHNNQKWSFSRSKSYFKVKWAHESWPLTYNIYHGYNLSFQYIVFQIVDDKHMWIDLWLI